MLVVGLTGNYGMGKTLVLEAFGELGAFTVNADYVVSELLEEKPVLEKLWQILGSKVFDKEGRLIKAKVSDMIFRDGNLRRAVEDILHPLVFETMEETLKRAKADIAVVEAPLLFERGYEWRFQKTVTVYTDESTALQRLESAGINSEDALGRLKSQMPVKEKIRRADFTIDNNGTVENTKRQVRDIYELLAGGNI